jgi:hypothetical protein
MAAQPSYRFAELGQRVALAWTGETAEIRVGGDEFTAVLDGQGGVVGVRNQLAASPCRQAQVWHWLENAVRAPKPDSPGYIEGDESRLGFAHSASK